MSKEIEATQIAGRALERIGAYGVSIHCNERINGDVAVSAYFILPKDEEADPVAAGKAMTGAAAFGASALRDGETR